MYTEGYKRYVVGALTLVYTSNCIDRGLIVLLLQRSRKIRNYPIRNLAL